MDKNVYILYHISLLLPHQADRRGLVVMVNSGRRIHDRAAPQAKAGHRNTPTSLTLLVILVLLLLLHTLPVRPARMVMDSKRCRHNGNVLRDAGRYPPTVVHDGVGVVHVPSGNMAMVTCTCVVDAHEVAVGAATRGALVVMRARVQLIQALTLLVRPRLSVEGWRAYSLSK